MPEFGPNRRAGEADAAWRAIRALAAEGFLAIDPIKLKPGQAEYEASPKVRLSVDREEELRTLAGIPRRGPGPQELWRQALNRAFGASDSRVERMASNRLPFVEGRTLDEVAGALKALDVASEWPDTPLRTVAARYFWGLSKFLDGREDLLAALFRTDASPFPGMRVHLPARVGSDDFKDVLVIENQDTFDLVCRITAGFLPAPVVLCAHGFRASASRIRNPAGCLPLYVHDARATDAGRRRFERWLFRTGEEGIGLWFWGDLDWEGMRILRAIREAFPTARSWSTGYGPMLEVLHQGGGHLPAEAGKEGQRGLQATGCPYADEQLIPALERHGKFLDQEVVRLEDLDWMAERDARAR